MSNSMPMKLSGSSALVTLLQRQNIRTLFCSTPRFEKKKEPSKKYSSTLLLPKTSFPMKVEGKKRIARDKEISEKCKFASQYSWQRENRYIWFVQKKNKNNYSFRTGSEYILHDGPPYANGSPHLGHAVNKILKDITGRWVGNKKSKNMLLILLKVSQCSWSTAPLGARFTLKAVIKCQKISITSGHWPGWDCHGLPIELKAIKGGKRLEASKVGSEGKSLTIFKQTKQTREIAGKFAADTVEAQSKEFQSWGLMADWENRYRLDRDWKKWKSLHVF